MKIRHILIASAALAAGPAFAQDAAPPQASAECASLQAQFDQQASTASSDQVRAAKGARNKGEKLCSQGKTEKGVAKLQEAISALSQPPRQPMEQPREQQPPDTREPSTQPPR